MSNIEPANSRRPYSEKPHLREAVLGLLVQRPSPAHLLALRMGERLRAARLPDNYVYWVLEDLERRKLVTREHSRASGPESAKRPTRMRNTICRATPAGVTHFRRWLTSPCGEPPLRDELMFRLALCGKQDIPRMVELVYDLERDALGHIQEMQFSTDELEAGVPEPTDAIYWKTMLQALSRDAELAHWSARVEWLQAVREMLEGLAANITGA